MDATAGDGGGRSESKSGGSELSISAILGTSDHHGESDELGYGGGAPALREDTRGTGTGASVAPRAESDRFLPC